MKKLIIVLMLFVAQISIAQTQHARVYFTDKPNVAASIANPTTILTAKAVNRKAAHGVAIDERDVPVNETYISTIKTQMGITVLAKSKWFNCIHVTGTQTDINALLSLSFVDEVVYADRSLNTTRSTTVTESNRTEEKFETLVMYNYGNAANQNQMINIHKLHELDFTGEGVTIAVIDGGFTNVNTMASFQRLRDNGDLLDGYDFVDRNPNVYAYTGNSHGTSVLSDMAGYIDGQFVGTAPDASYYLFRTEDAASETPVEESYWVEAAERADSLGVDIVNTSLGYNTFDDSRYDYTTADMNGNTAFITKGSNIAVEKGLLIVNSAGNSGGDPAWGIITAPADGNGFSIGAVDGAGNYASFSSRGPTADGRVKPDVVAHGSSVYAISDTDMVVTTAGTSFSAPIISGAMACLLQAYPNKTNLELMQLVRESSSIYTTPNNELGYGIPNFETAFQALSVEGNKIDAVKIYPNPTTSTLVINIPYAHQNTTATLGTMLGKIVKTYQIQSNMQTIDISVLQAGIYTLHLNINGTQLTQKIIKQ